MLVVRGDELGLQFNQSGRFTSAHRLMRIDGFDQTIRGVNLSDRNFKIFFMINRKENARLGIVIQKKIISGSVERNQLKRFIRETFRLHGIKFCKLDIVVMVRHSYSKNSDTQIILRRLFTKVEDRCAELQLI